ncbi:MAG: undecaprenyl-phosphate galactose phosphotransferase WbaP [Spirochaetaceae bacterium]|jgi:Undecaprenyl-phosphate galactose phosphotransferase WbaP|nr:undecaprenyl-phosphate galactose phosphotransferase WbaP [Spirochaetaceae bacterium]
MADTIGMTLDDFERWYKESFARTSSTFTTIAMIIADLAGVMLSFGAGFFFVNLYDPVAINFRSFITYWPYLPLFILVFYVSSLYPGVSLAPAEELRRIFIASLMSHGSVILSRYVNNKALDIISAAFFLGFLFSTLIILLCRSLMRAILSKTKLGGIPAVIYGGGSTGRLIIDKLLNKRSLAYVPVLILDDDERTGVSYRGVPIIHDTSLGPQIVKRFRIKVAIVAMNNLKRKELVRLLNYSVSAFRYNVMIPDFFGMTSVWMSARDFDGILGLATIQRLKMRWNLAIKRGLDLIIVIFGGIVILPFMLLIALAICISSPGKAIYAQTRVGQNGRHFKTYKFRTMMKDADDRLKKLLESDEGARIEWEASRKLKNDPRVTKLGAFLRKTSLDEFPQLINVLKGDMSLVGPRPIVDDEIKKYEDDFQRIFSVKPGITGLWQVSGRSDTNYKDRVSFDTYYLQNWSIWLDMWILYRTIWVVLGHKGAY